MPYFKKILFDHFFSRSVRDVRAKEFASFVQRAMIVHQYVAKFVDLSHFAYYLIPDEGKRA